MSLRERVARAVDEFLFYRRRQMTPRSVPQTITYRQPHIAQEPERKERKIALFGGDVGAFGEDYLVSKSIPVAPIGVREGVPRIEQENIQGAVSGQPLRPLERPYEDASTSMVFQRRFQDTDQKAVPRGGSPMSVWDGGVRTSGKSSGVQGVRGKSAPTPADLHERDLRNAPYDFSA